jgi:hypothetical protein
MAYSHLSTAYNLQEDLDNIPSDMNTSEIEDEIAKHKTIGYLSAGISLLNLFTINTNLHIKSRANGVNFIYEF